MSIALQVRVYRRDPHASLASRGPEARAAKWARGCKHISYIDARLRLEAIAELDQQLLVVA
jgi:hypothetical protein